MPGSERLFEALLPIGYSDESGRTHRRALLRKLSGHDEALLYDGGLSAAGLVTDLIAGCLVRLGELEPVPRDVVARMYSADRNYLLVELRRITLGDQISTAYVCPSCGTYVHVLDDLSTLPVLRLDDAEPLTDIVVELDDGFRDRDGQTHTTITLSLPTGVDEDFVAPMLDKDPLKARDALLLRCIRRFGTLPHATLESYGVKILRDLTLGDRLRLQRASNDGTPGVDLRRQVLCGHCGTRSEHVLDATDFLALA